MTLIGPGTVGVRPHGTLALRQITHGAITQVGLEALAYHFYAKKYCIIPGWIPRLNNNSEFKVVKHM